MRIELEKSFADPRRDLSAEILRAQEALALLCSRKGKGSEFTGWVGLPENISAQDIDAIEQIAAELRACSDCVVVVGIGGSYLGARAVIDALSPVFGGQGPEILYAGHHLDADYYAQLLAYLEGKRWSIIVISKSGTTTEPAVAYRLLRERHVAQFGPSESARRTVAVTDRQRGALLTLARQAGIRTFVIPDDIGGRYSVLTPVGLLPIAVAGIDLRQLLAGAKAAMGQCRLVSDTNPAVLYAAARNKLYAEGKKIEMLITYHPRLQYFIEWWKQLFGESEGKEHKGVFNAGAVFTTDLHSMGQYIQQGERHLFETLIEVQNAASGLTVEPTDDDLDGLNYLAGKDLHSINLAASQATLMAHTRGGVPNLVVSVPRLDAESLGELIYFFEISCGISGYMLGVNPFDQPGVEDYKNNMFALLGKPGYV